MRISDWSSDVCSSDLVAGGQRAGDRGRIVIFEAALGLAAVGADIEARDAKIGGFAVDFIGRVRRIILAVARVGLVFAIVEIIDRIIGVIFGRVAVAERGFPLRIMASLKVEADAQAAGADRAAVTQAKAALGKAACGEKGR